MKADPVALIQEKRVKSRIQVSRAQQSFSD